MTNLEALRQELIEFVDEATDRDLFNMASSLGYDICDYCVTTSCDRDCFKGFALWGQQEHEDKLFKLLENLQSVTSVSASLTPAERKNIGRLSKLSMSWSTGRF